MKSKICNKNLLHINSLRFGHLFFPFSQLYKNQYIHIVPKTKFSEHFWKGKKRCVLKTKKWQWLPQPRKVNHLQRFPTVQSG